MVRLFHVYEDGWQSHHHSSSYVQFFNKFKPNSSEITQITFGNVTYICQHTHPRQHPIGVFLGDNPLNFGFTLLMLQFSIIVIITQVVRCLLRPLKQPRIVAEIIGGLCVGPTVLGRNQEFYELIFPQNSRYVMANMGLIGFMFFLFVAGVKMDVSLLKKVGRKHYSLALIGSILPIGIMMTTGYMLRSSMQEGLASISGISGVAESLSITSFPVIYVILKELNLLSSEIGKLALTITVISDALGIFFMITWEGFMQAEGSNTAALWFSISMVVFGAFIVIGIRRVLRWIVKNTPEGQPVNQSFVGLILLGALAMGFLTDMLGVALINGSFWLGLVIPDGPPLGATLVEKSESIVNEILMPYAFAIVGMYSDVFTMASDGWSSLAPLFTMVMAGYFSKLFIIIVVAFYLLQIPLKDGLTLGLIMILRGQTELMIYLHWLDKKMIDSHLFTMLVLVTAAMTAICAFLINILYNPTRPYMSIKRRTIQHTPPNAELSVLVCIHDQEYVASLIDLLEISYPTIESPLIVYAMHLIELVGRAYPIFIDHDEVDEDSGSRYLDHEDVYHALKLYQEARDEFVELHSFTVMTAKQTMYLDICELALAKETTLIILPFRIGTLDYLAGTEMVRHAYELHSLNSHVLSHSPCSVGILVDKGHQTNRIRGDHSFHSIHKYIFMLFLGGADAREALAYADRMARNPEVTLMVVRFLSYNNMGDDHMEKKLDDGMVTRFWVKNEANERVSYREVVVKNGEEVLAAIWAMKDDSNGLWIVGRQQGINPVLLEGLSKWSENPELGVIGDFVASEDFGSTASVLVIHQQITRG